MAKPIGPRCNIDCTYCYYLDKARLYPGTGKFRMPEDVLECYIRDHIAAQVAAGMQEIDFYWQGGEPTILGIDYFRRILGLQDKYRPDGVHLNNALQTNGTLLDAEWADFLHDNRFLVGISIDGPKRLHDRYRRNRAGQPTFAAAMRGLDLLMTHGVDYNVLVAVNRLNALKPAEVYRFLRGLGVEFIQFIPIVERTTDGHTLAPPPQSRSVAGDPRVAPFSVSPRAYGHFLCEVFDLWVRHDVGRISVQHFDVVLELWMGMPATLCHFAPECGQELALEHNGDLYACDHYVYPEYLLGNITRTPISELASLERQRAFGRDKARTLPPECRACPYLFACNGGCPKHRFRRSHDGEAGLNYFCESYRMFFRHAGPWLDEMARLVGSGQSLTEQHPIPDARKRR